jgi:hypothetical protein
MYYMTFIDILQNYNIEPSEYLKIARRNAKRNKYNASQLEFSDKPQYKLMMYDKNKFKYIFFGASDYKDYIIYTLLDGQQEADKRRIAYLSRALNIKGDWKTDKYSKNNLAISILWSGY